MPVSDKPMAYKEFAAIKSQILTELKLTPTEWVRILGQNLDSTGNPQNLLSTAGAVTEASAATIATYTASLQYPHAFHGHASVAVQGTTAGLIQAYPKKKVVAIATDGAGDAAATELVGTVAGYYPVIDSILVISPEAEATTILTFSASAGALNGPAANTLNLVADTMNTQLKDGLWYTTTDGATLSVAITSGPTTNTVYVQVEYHYET